MITDFLRWKPAPITSVGALVRAVAPPTRLLRGEVLDQLDTERRAIKAGEAEASQPFLGLARDWRTLLFPTATDDVFADGTPRPSPSRCSSLGRKALTWQG